MRNKTAVLVSCFGWYEDRLQLVREYLIEHNYDVTVLLSDFNHLTKEKNQITHKECTYLKVIKYKKNISILRILSHIQFAQRVNNYLHTFRPSLIYALVPPNSVARICAKYKKNNESVKLVFDIMDMWPESMISTRKFDSLPYRYWKWLRDSSLEVSDHIFTECRLYQEEFKANIKDKSSTLYLAKKKKDFSFDKQARGVDVPNKQLVKLGYLGSINHIIDIDGICKIVKALSDKCEVEVSIIGSGENSETFIDALKKAGANVLFYGPVFDDNKKCNILGKCDFALNMMKEKTMVGLTTKSIDYFSFGLPIINNIKGDTWALVNDLKIGINFDGDIDKFLLDFFNSKNHFSSVWVYNQFQQTFSKEVFFKNLDRGLHDV